MSVNNVRFETIDHRVCSVAAAVHEVQRQAYEQEALLLKLAPAEFPPLHRTRDEIQGGPERFIAAIECERIVGVIGVEPAHAASWSGMRLDSAHIASLAVLPEAQRRGIGRRLVQAAINSHGPAPLTVSTAMANIPALLLYRRLAFEEISRRTIPCGGQMLELILLKRSQKG